MALDLIDTYNGQVAEGDVSYPYGMAQNVGVEGDGSGTPWEAQLVNDWLGFFQGLLLAADIVPSGVADTALSSQYLSALQWIAEAARSTFNVRSSRYGAVGTGLADDTAAIQDAIDAAALVYGEVFFPPGQYLHGSLNIPAGVSLRGVADKTFLLHNHATSNALVFSGTGNGHPVTVTDLRLLAAVSTTGEAVVTSVGARVQLIRCTLNGVTSGGSPSSNYAQGLISASASASEIDLVDCSLFPATGGFAIATQGKLNMTRGRVVMPATYSAQAVVASSGGQLRLTDVEYDCSAHVSGTGIFVHAQAGSYLHLSNSRISGASGINVLLTWDEGANVFEAGTIRTSSGIKIYGSTVETAPGSRLELLPSVETNQGSATSIDLSAFSGFRSIMLQSSAASNPTIALFPAILFRGQRLTLTIRNTGSNWTVVTVTGAVPSGFGGVLATGTKTLIFEATDYAISGTSQWVCISERG
jgi:hypothetical protein